MVCLKAVEYSFIFSLTVLQYFLNPLLGANGILVPRLKVWYWQTKGKLAREIQKNAGRWIADTIPSLSSQSERAKNTIH